jgi:hypothetical protein
MHMYARMQLLQLNGQQHELQSNLSHIGGELTALRDLPAQLSLLQTEHAEAQNQLAETLATLDELSLLSAAEVQKRDAALAELEGKFAALSAESQVEHK